MKFKIILLSICSLIFWESTLQAQGITMSLKECIERAKENNLQLKQGDFNKKLAEINLKDAEGNRLPNLNASANLGVNSGRTLDFTTYELVSQTIGSNSLSLNSSMPIFNGFQIKNTIEQRELEIEESGLTNETLVYNISLNVLSAYLQVVIAQEQIGILEKQVELSKANYEQSQKLVRAGVLPQGDLLDIEAQMANEELTVINAQNNLEAAYLALGQLLEYYEPFKIVAPSIKSPSNKELEQNSPFTIYNDALKDFPAIRRDSLSTLISQKQVMVAEGGKYPTLNLGGSVTSRYSTAGTIIATGEKASLIRQWNDNLGLGLSLNLNVPIFNGYQVNNRIQRAEINVLNTRMNQQITKNNLRRDIEAAYQQARAAAKRYESSTVSLVAQRKSFEHAEKRLKLGMINSLDFTRAKNNLLVAELSQQQAKYEYFFRLKILDYYQGKPLNIN